MVDTINVQNRFAESLKFLREKGGLTQSQLADKLGVSRGSISFYENKDRVPDIIFLDKVADYFGIGYDFLMGFSDNMNPNNTDIGLRLGLSDEAIEKWERNDCEFLSDLIEDDDFDKFIKYCQGFLFEESWRNFQSVGARAFNDQTPAYPFDVKELEDYRIFQLTKIFVGILSRIKAKKYYESLTSEQIEANQKRFEESVARWEAMKEDDEKRLREDLAELKNDEAFQIRSRVLNAIYPGKGYGEPEEDDNGQH